MTLDQRRGIELFYVDMYDLLFIYARNALKNESLAEEAIQETFRIACTKPDDLFSSSNPKGWIINTLKYTIQNTKRNLGRANVLLTQYLAVHSSSVVFSEDQIRLEFTYENVAHSDEFQLIKEMAVEGKSHSRWRNPAVFLWLRVRNGYNEQKFFYGAKYSVTICKFRNTNN